MRSARRLPVKTSLARTASRSLQSWRFRRDFPNDAALYHEPNFLPYAYGLRPTVITVHDVSWLRYPGTHPASRAFPDAPALPGGAAACGPHHCGIRLRAHRRLLALCDVNPDKIRVVHNGVANRFRPYPDDTLRAILPSYGLHPRYCYFMALGTLRTQETPGHGVASACPVCLPHFGNNVRWCWWAARAG
ncbi:hypothetical protein ACU4GD_14905 [Cupriavidus basilensis]